MPDLKLIPTAQLTSIVATSNRVVATSRRNGKIHEVAECLRQLAEHEIEIGVLYLSGEIAQGKIGIGSAALRAAAQTPPTDTPQLLLTQVDEFLSQLATIKGSGSAAERTRQLRELFSQATANEQEFLLRLLSGELRQGALAGVMVDAIAVAANIPINEVRRAAMYAPHLGSVARAALHEERTALLKFELATLSPIAPMLAETAVDVADAFEQLGDDAAFEWKIDGARIQVHKRNEHIRVYTRSLNDVAYAVPEVLAAVHALPAKELVLDGEVAALDQTGNPLPFQITMRRFGRKLDIETLQRELPLYPFFFDCLKLDDTTLADRPARERFAALASVVPENLRVPQLINPKLNEAEAFYAQALAKGHEGVMAKSLSSPYEAASVARAGLK